MYYIGQGVSVDYKEAVKWCRLAAEQGNALTQAKLGIMYEHGTGVPQDYVLSHMWYNIANANADSETMSRLPTEKLTGFSFGDMRDSIAKEMTAQQIGEAQELARKCTAKKFKGC